MTSDAAPGSCAVANWVAAGGAYRHVLVLLVLAGLAVGVHLAHPALLDPDEPRSALVSRLMAERGDWLVPRLPLVLRHDYPSNPVEGDTLVYWDKPPLYFWLSAAAMKVLGPTPLAARLAAGLAHVAAVLLVWAAAGLLWDRRAGLMAGAAMAVAPLSLVMAHVGRMETLLAALVTAMLLAVLRLWAGAGRPWVWTLVLYGSAGLGLLAKGPVAAVLPAVAVLCAAAAARRRGDLARLRPLAGLLVMLAIAAPWYIYMHCRYPAGADGSPGFSQAFFISQHFDRVAAGLRGHAEHLPGYLPGVLLVGFMPWTIFLPEAVVRLVRENWRRRRERPGVVLVLAWALALVVPFCFSKTQMPHYVVPAVPPLAMLMGAYLAERTAAREGTRLFASGLWVTVVVGVGVLAAVVLSLQHDRQWHAAYVPVVAVLVGLLWAGATALVRRWRSASVALLAAGTACLTAFIFVADPLEVYRHGTTRLEVRRIQHDIEPDDRVLAYPYVPYSLVWYLWPRQVPPAPADETALAAEMNRPVRTFCVIQKKDVVPRIQKAVRWPTKVLSRTPGHTVVVTEPAAVQPPPGKHLTGPRFRSILLVVGGCSGGGIGRHTSLRC